MHLQREHMAQESKKTMSILTLIFLNVIIKVYSFYTIKDTQSLMDLPVCIATQPFED